MTHRPVARVDALDPDDPTSIARYRLLGRLGAGGMGVVYLGQDPRGERVAVKLVRPELAGHPEFRERFGREVRSAQRVRGRHTARVLAADTSGWRQWVATEFVDGPTLEEHVARHGPMRLADATAMAVALADGLASIHAAGLVHRDLKPSNVILSEDGPTVIDFGIARALEATGVTATGTMLGTLQWMSPEQLTGAKVTPASDTFTWGLVATYAATGRHPFGEGRPEAVAFRIAHHSADLAPLPPPLGLAVAAALDPDPSRRPPASHLGVMLAAADDITPAAATRADATRRDAGPNRTTVVSSAEPLAGTRWTSTRVAALAAASAVVLGFLGALGTGAWPLIADRVGAVWDTWAADTTAAGDRDVPTAPSTPTPTPEPPPAPTAEPAPDEAPGPSTRSSGTAAAASGSSAASTAGTNEPLADHTVSVDRGAGAGVSPEFTSSCTWDPPQPSPSLATAVMLTGRCDGLGPVSVQAQALTDLASETDDTQVLLTGDLGGSELYLTLYPSAPQAGAPDPGQRWWSWGGSTNNRRGDPVSVLGTQRVDRATGQTWWEIGGDNLAREADEELGVDLVTTMGGAYDNFECTGPRGTGTGSEATWPATGQVRGIHHENDQVDTPMAAAVCSLMTHAVPASGIATRS